MQLAKEKYIELKPSQEEISVFFTFQEPESNYKTCQKSSKIDTEGTGFFVNLKMEVPNPFAHKKGTETLGRCSLKLQTAQSSMQIVD